MDVSTDRIIEAYADTDQRFHCMKCRKALHSKDVAMFIRSSPDEGFWPWCPRCTYWIVRHAAVGMGDEAGEPF